jgi:hypothetical protein
MDVSESSKYAREYLVQRGILDASLALGADILVGKSHPRGVYRERLGFDTWNGKSLADTVSEAIFFPCVNAGGNIQSYFCRVFPPPKDKEGKPAKFLTPKNVSYPFIPKATWEVASKPGCPICLTEGPCKAISVLEAGGLPIGLGGVWMATTVDAEDRIDLHPVLSENFQWKGRRVFLVFDADVSTNPSVRRALIRTWIVLLARGVDAKVLRWPIAEGKGIDDYLAAKTKGKEEQ